MKHILSLQPLLPSPKRQIFTWFFLLMEAGIIAVASGLFVGRRPLDIPTKFFLLAAAAITVMLIHWIRTADTETRLNLQALIKVDPKTALRILGLAVQLGLLILVIREFKLDKQAFYLNILPVAFYGFLLQFFLPTSDRLPFFLFLSLATLSGVLGVANSIWVVGVGLFLVGVVHLPVAFRLRILILALAVALLAFSRAGFLQTLPAVAWPILGSLFMFRLLTYVYDLKYTKKPFNPWSTLSYFFLLPNVVFPLFPVVDYAAFIRTYNNDDSHRIYQTGINWMIRGAVQLILHRAVYTYLVIDPAGVATAFDLVQYAYAGFLLFLQVSGQFHLTVGLLHLFGFNLPQSSDRYFLAVSFTDLWRRLNIYWKDFMQKLFYYPAYFWLTKRGVTGTRALVLTIFYVFIATWFLFAYQWFWLRGDFLLMATDIAFWMLMALLVIASTLRGRQQGRKRRISAQSLTNREIVRMGVNNMFTLSMLTFLWTMWASPSLGDWSAMWKLALEPVNLPIIGACFAGLTLAFIGLNWLYTRFFPIRPAGRQPTARLSPVWVNIMFLIGIFMLGSAAVHDRVGGEYKRLFVVLTSARPREGNANLHVRRYHEELIEVDRYNRELWNVYFRRPVDWPNIQDTRAGYVTQDLRLIALRPSISINFHGETFTTNHWGMRDREYEQTPSARTYRVALVGSSIVMGSGAADSDVFEWVLEDRLNAEFGGQQYAKYEILNFAVAGHSALQELYVFENTILQFQPDALFFFSHQSEETRIAPGLANRISIGAEIPYPWLRDIVRDIGLQPGMPQDEVESLLEPYAGDIVNQIYQEIAALAKDYGILPVWIYMPMPGFPESESAYHELVEEARAAGFITLNLSDVYAGYDLFSITVAPWDLHPNRMGHLLIADRLFEEILSTEAIRTSFGIDP